jgi:hypothetical protein
MASPVAGDADFRVIGVVRGITIRMPLDMIHI